MPATATHIVTRDELNSLLWGAADILRGTADAGDYKNHILALLFLKRLSDVFDERRDAIISDWIARGRSRSEAEEVANDPDEYRFFIPATARWSHLNTIGENRAEAIDTALEAVEEQNGQYLEGVLAGVRFNDARRFGDPDEMDGIMGRLLTHFSRIPLGNANLAEPDVLGNSYEYLIERFAETSGKKGGEFYTPRMVVKLIVELLRPQEGMRIHDPTVGSGGMLIECGKYVEDHGGSPRNLTLTGQERNVGTLAICKLNMILHDFTDADIRAGDTIRNPKFQNNGQLQRFDRVIANPPFSLKDWGHDYAQQDSYRRFNRGVPPKTKGDTAFLQHMIEVCNDDGMVGVVMPHGVLFRGGAEEGIRRALLEEDLFEAVIGLPSQLFFGTGIPASVLILNRNKPESRRGRVLVIDASSEGMYKDAKARNYLRTEDLLRIIAVFNAYDGDLRKAEVHEAVDHIASQWNEAVCQHEDRQLAKAEGQDQELVQRIMDEAGKQKVDIHESMRRVHFWLDNLGTNGEEVERPDNARDALEKFAAVVSLEEIAEENNHNLNISRYVDPNDPPPILDVAEELAKLRELEGKRNEAEQRMDELLAELGYDMKGQPQ